ncbi:MAG: helix-turn-helix domain-containing protein [bacterium]
MKKPQPLSKSGLLDAGKAGSKIGANQSKTEFTKPGTKTHTILTALLRGSLNRFEAERLGDHCLPSSISALRMKGYNVMAEWETVPTRFGKPCRVKRYRIPNAETSHHHERRTH